MKINGHSNFSVTLHLDHDVYFVRKQSLSVNDNLRLEHQLWKQENHIKTKNITTPSIIQNNKIGDLFYFDMEYCNCLSFAELFEKKSYKYIQHYFEMLLIYIDDNIAKSTIADVTNDVRVKYEAVKNQILKSINFDFRPIDSIFKNIQTMYLPIGVNHGDLTMSNVLFDDDNRKLVFIDFLDSFIETPMNDIVKLRQDTQFKWSLNLLTEKRDVTKLNIVFDQLDKYVASHFNRYEFYVEHYKVYQLLNLLRVLQYAKSSDTINKLTTNIKNLLYEEFNSTMCW